MGMDSFEIIVWGIGLCCWSRGNYGSGRSDKSSRISQGVWLAHLIYQKTRKEIMVLQIHSIMAFTQLVYKQRKKRKEKRG